MIARPGLKLGRQLARLTLVLENAPVILYGLDSDGRFLFSEGDGLAREALALRAGLPILFMSGHPRESLPHAGVLPGGVNYLPKPFTPDTLSRKVREVLDALIHE
jgi:FixJ family two-component response regulator